VVSSYTNLAEMKLITVVEMDDGRHMQDLSRRVDRLDNELCQLWRIQVCLFILQLVTYFVEAYSVEFNGEGICLRRVN
jgi:hypothetical protein